MRPTRRLNAKFLIGLVAAAALAGGGVYLLHGFQIRRSSRALLARANQAGRADKAADYLARYLAYNPGDVAVLARYGRLREDMARTPEQRRQVAQIYEKVVRLAPADRDARLRLVRLEVPLEMYSQAKAHLKILRESAKDDGELAYLLGRCEEGTGQFPEAAQRYEEARKQDPKRAEAYTRLADLLRLQLDDPGRADRVMDARGVDGGLIAANGDSAAAYLARARYRRRYDVEADAATADVDRALELAPEDPDVLLAAADAAQARAAEARGKGDSAGAEAELTRAIQRLERGVGLHPETIALYSSLSQLELRAGRPEKAADWLRKGIRAVPEEATTLGWVLADLLLSVGRVDEAAEVIDGGKPDAEAGPGEAAKGLRKAVRPELLGYLDARVLVARGRWAEAAKALEGAAPTLAAGSGFDKELAKRAYLQLAQCYGRLDDSDRRLVAARQAVGVALPDPDPIGTAARLELAAALTAAGKADEALAQYRIALPHAPQAGLAAARLQIAQTLSRPAPGRDWAAVDRTLDELDRVSPDAPEAAILRAEALAARGETAAAARAPLDRALAKAPERVDLWVAKALLAGREGNSRATLDVLDEAQRRLGDRVELRLARSNYWAARGGDGAAEALAALERGAETFRPEDRDRLWRELGAAYTRIGRDDDARRLWIGLADRRPDDLDLRLLLFDLAARTGDDAGARAALDQIRRIEGEGGALWSYGRARLLIAQARRSPGDKAPLAEAQKLLEQAAARRPGWAQVPLAEAEVAELSGRPEDAIAKYQRAITELGARHPAAIRQALKLLYERKQYGRALALVEQLRREGPIPGELRRLPAELAYLNRDYDRASELAREGLSDRSDDYRDLLLLGRIYRATGRPAAPLFRRAVALAPGAPEAHAELIEYLAVQGQKDEATAALREAERALPKDRAALTLARGYEAVGDAERADRLYRAALDARPDDPDTLRAVAVHHLARGRIGDAEPLLQRLAGRKGDPADAAWARQALAQLAALRGGPEAARRALQLLGLDKSDPRDADPGDVRTKAKILGAQPGRAKRREAIALLERLVERRDDIDDDRFSLARLYEADGDWPKAREQMLKLLDARGKDPAYLAYYVQALLRHDRAREAQVYLGRLEQAAPGQPATVLLKARVLKALDRGDEAVAALRGLARDRDDLAGPVARLLEEIGEYAAAEPMYRAYVEKARAEHPEAVLALAGFLGRRGRLGEAIDLIDDDRAWQAIPAETVAGAGVDILNRSKPADERQCRRLERRIEEAIRRHPDSPELRFGLANIRILQGRYADAEAIFRAVYESDKRRGGPLNNLAWLIALRGDGRGAEALSLIEQAIALEGELPALLDTRAVVRLAAGQAEPAIRDLEDAIAAEPQAEMYFHLARAYRQAGKRAEANDAFRKAKSLGLTAEALHPLEREAFDQLAVELARR